MIRVGIAALHPTGVALELTGNHNYPAPLDRTRADGIDLLDCLRRSSSDRLVDLERELVAKPVDISQDGRQKRRSATLPFVERANGIADAFRVAFTGTGAR